jgi:hypothetical protein
MNLKNLENQFLNKKIKNVSKIHCPSFLQDALNSPYLPCNRLIELKGDVGSGKLPLSITALKEAQTEGILAGILDFDNHIDPLIFKKWSINTDNIIYSNISEPDESFEILFKLLESKKLSLIIVNSLLSLFPLTYDYQWFRTKLNKLQSLLKTSNCCLIILNPYNNSRYDCLNQYSSIVLSIKKRHRIKHKEEILGWNIDGKILKNTYNLQLNPFHCKYLHKYGVE